MNENVSPALLRRAVGVAVGLAVTAGLGGCVASSDVSKHPLSVVHQFKTHPETAPASVNAGDKHIVHNGSGSASFPVKLPANARSVTMFLTCDEDVDGTLAIRSAEMSIASVTFEGCGGTNWSSGGHDVDRTSSPIDAASVTVKKGVAWTATIYVSGDPIPTQ